MIALKNLLKSLEGHPNAKLELMSGRSPRVIKNGEVTLIVNTVEDKRSAVRDSYSIRRAALQQRVSLFTTVAGARAACAGMEEARELRVYSIQQLHARLPAAVN